MARNNKYTSLNFNDIFDKKTSSLNTTSSASSNTRFTASKSPSSSNSSYLSASRLSHGGMLVLSRPKPQPQPQSPPPVVAVAVTPPETDVISLRPQGKTSSSSSSSSASTVMEKVMSLANSTPKSDKFVPPHLRAGYVAKEVVIPEFTRPRSANNRPGSGHGYHGSPDVNIRPLSGHGYQQYHNGSPIKYMDNGRGGPGGGGGGGGYQNQSMDSFRPRSGNGQFLETGRPGSGGGFRNAESDYVNRPRSGGSRPSSSSGWLRLDTILRGKGRDKKLVEREVVEGEGE